MNNWKMYAVLGVIFFALLLMLHSHWVLVFCLGFAFAKVIDYVRK